MSSIPSSMPKLEDKEVTEADMTKEMQIIILKEKLQLSEKLLTDKDVQLEGYKQLVKTLKDILADVSRQKNSMESATVINPPPPKESSRPMVHQVISAPPGFQPKSSTTVQPLTKEKEQNRSFHLDSRDRGESREDSRQIRPTPSAPAPRESGLQSGKGIGLRRTYSETRGKLRDNGESSSSSSERPRFGRDGKSRSLPSLAQIGEIAGQVYSLSKTQQGCRLLQTKLEEDPSSIGVIFKELEGHLLELMLDPFGNYLFTKLVESCSHQEKDKICQEILPESMTAATDKYGSQCLQKMFSHLNEDQMGLFIGSLKSNCSRLIKHEKANYLIQFFLELQSNQWIYDAVCGEMENVGSDKFGCVIIKKCLDRATDDQRAQLISSVLDHVMVLVEDQFGNYIVQHILDKYPGPDSSAPIIRSLLGHIVDLCTQKFSSPVVERCLRVADVEVQNAILEEITSSGFLAQLINDRFANFVIQTALDVADHDQREILVKTLLPHLNGAHTPYSKRLREKILQTQ